MTIYRETMNFILSPAVESIEFTCPSCQEPVVLELDGLIYAIEGCDNCGCSLSIEARLCITAEAQ